MSVGEVTAVGGRTGIDGWVACRDGNDCYLSYYLLSHSLMEICNEEAARGYGKGNAHGAGAWTGTGYAG